MQGVQQQQLAVGSISCTSGMSLVQLASCCCSCVPCFNWYQSQFTLHLHLWWSSFAATCANAGLSPPACTGGVPASISCEKVPENRPLHTPIMPSPLHLEPGCCFIQELKWLSYECLQTAHFVIHVHFIVINCTLPCISLIWVHHMSGL